MANLTAMFLMFLLAGPEEDAAAALALAASRPATDPPAVAPPEEPDLFFPSFAEAKRKARLEDLPLVVFIGVEARSIKGAVACEGGRTPGYPRECIVVSERGGVWWAATLPPTATDAEIRRAAGLEAGAKPLPFRQLDPRSIPRKTALPDVRDADEPEFRAWDRGQTYQFGDRVMHNGTLWMARKDHSGSEPGAPPYKHWLNVNFEK